MPINPYFNYFPKSKEKEKTKEQSLYEKLIVESIKIRGHDVQYIPRENWESMDRIFGENVDSKFEKAYTIEMYIGNYNGWSGQQDLFTKFGHEMRDSANFVVAKWSFNREIPESIRINPRDGDLIYSPVMRNLFEIKFVEEDHRYFPLGYQYPFVFDLRCEVFRYSHESISTGIPEIDSIVPKSTYNVIMDVDNGDGDYIIGEVIFQGSNVNSPEMSATVSNWNRFTKKLQVHNISGNIIPGNAVIGMASSTEYLVSNADVMSDSTLNDIFINAELQNKSNTVVQIEQNPFGRP